MMSQYLQSLNSQDMEDPSILLTRKHLVTALALWASLGLVLIVFVYPFFGVLNLANRSFKRESSLYFLQEPKLRALGVLQTILGVILLLITMPIACPLLYFIVLAYLMKQACFTAK